MSCSGIGGKHRASLFPPRQIIALQICEASSPGGPDPCQSSSRSSWGCALLVSGQRPAGVSATGGEARARRCKENDVMNVKIMMSRHQLQTPRQFCQVAQDICIRAVFIMETAHQVLDNISSVDVIVFAELFAHISTTRSRPATKASNPPQARQLQSGTRVGHPSLVSQERFFRSRRPAPDQVRDDASGPCRQQFHQRLRTGLRLFSYFVLSSAK